LLNRAQPFAEPATKLMMIHVMRDGQQFGPYTLEDVNAYLAQGTLLATDQAWYEGAPDWMLLTQVPGVLGPGAAPAPVADPMAAANPAVATADAAVISVANQGNKKKKIMIIAGSTVGVLAIAGVLCFVYPGFLKKDDDGSVDDGGGGGGGSQTGGSGGGGNTFALKVKPIFNKTACYDCHDGADPEDKPNKALNLAINESILEDVDLKDPDNSELIKRLTDTENPMPKNGKPRMLTSDEVDTIKAWIKAGAKF
jgi:hypothetical protein